MIGAVLGWKFNHTPGIMTRDEVITQWPEALGPLPTQAQLDTWVVEYEAYLDGEKQKADADKAKKDKAKVDLNTLITTENPDPTKWKIEDVVAHLKQVEILIGVR